MHTEHIDLGEALSIPDFLQRWQKARLSAIAFADVELELQTQSEMESLLQIRAEQEEALLKQVYLNSFRLGRSVVEYTRMVWDPKDYWDVLRRAQIPCAIHAKHELTTRYEQSNSGCVSNPDRNTLVCDYWREACDGLASGTLAEWRFARYKSLGAGDDSCLDVLYAIEDATMRYAPLSADLAEDLESFKHKYLGSPPTSKIEFLGIAEGQLYYRMQPTEKDGCSATSSMLPLTLEHFLAKKYPLIRLRNASPIAVLTN